MFCYVCAYTMFQQLHIAIADVRRSALTST